MFLHWTLTIDKCTLKAYQEFCHDLSFSESKRNHNDTPDDGRLTKALWSVTCWCRQRQSETAAGDGEQEADFISCITFGKSAEFAQKYLHKGMRIVIGGRISTGSYKDKDGKTIYTTDVIVEEHEFAQNKDSGAGADSLETAKTDKDRFMEAKDGEIPFD